MTPGVGTGIPLPPAGWLDARGCKLIPGGGIRIGTGFARALVVQFIGFGLAAAVLLDATLIRIVLVPAFMQVAGEWNWWPGGRGRRIDG